MIPAKIKDFIAESAKSIGIPEEHLSNMVSFYFKESRKRMSRLENTQFVFRGLGVMKIKGWDIEKEIEKLQKRITLTRDPDAIKELQDQVVIYEKAKKKWDEQMDLKKKAGDIKRNYYANKTTNNNELEGEDTISMGE